MDKIFIVAKREFLERVRTRTFVIVTLIVPIFFMVVMLGPAYLAMRSRGSEGFRHIIVLDATGRGLGARLASNLTNDLASVPDSLAPAVRTIAPADLKKAEQRAETEVRTPQSF